MSLGVEVMEPASERELLDQLGRLARAGRRWAPLGAGLSFDGQGLPERVAVSCERLRHIHVDPDHKRLRVGAGVRMGEALAATLPFGLALPILPSTRYVMMGGSASADSYSRMTPGFGRESRYIREIRLATPNGALQRCSRDENADLFYAAVGGFGLVGLITELEYELVSVGAHPVLASSAHAFESVSGLAFLVPENRPKDLPAGAWPGAGSLIMERGGVCRTLLTRHRYEDTTARAPTIVHRPAGLVRVGLELLVREFPGLAAWLWERNWTPGEVLEFRDDLVPASFFMDANLAATDVARRLGRESAVMQQSFSLPVTSRGAAAAEGVRSFVEEMVVRFREAGLKSAMLDVGFLPRAEPFVTSVNGNSDAYLASAAFLVGPRSPRSVVADVLEELTARCTASHGGRVHLTKQACCSDESLRAAYAPAIAELRRVRSIHDPDRLIETALGKRLGL